jgi:thiosulfate dehydrogenase [quinone] large subunit
MNTELAYLIIRIGLGLNIFLHGFVRIRAGRHNFKKAIEAEFAGTILEGRTAGMFALYLPLIEFVTGLLLLAGLFTEPAIITGSLVMLFLIVGKSIKSDWQTVTFQMVYVAFYAVLEMLLEHNVLSADKLVSQLFG